MLRPCDLMEHDFVRPRALDSTPPPQTNPVPSPMPFQKISTSQRNRSTIHQPSLTIRYCASPPNVDLFMSKESEVRNSNETDGGCLRLPLSATLPSPQKLASFQIRCRRDLHNRRAFQRPALQWDHEPFYPRQLPPWRSFHRASP